MYNLYLMFVILDTLAFDLRCTTMDTNVDFWVVPLPAVVWSV